MKHEAWPWGAFDSFSKQPFRREIVWGLDSPIRYAGGVMAFLPLNELPALFPHVVNWISYLEKQAQESGRALTSIEFNLAQHVGLAHPEEVRILSVPRIPLPAHPRVKQLAKQVGLLNADTGGLTAVYGVIVRRDCTNTTAAGTRIRSCSPARATGKRRISARIHSTNRRARIPEIPVRIRRGSQERRCRQHHH